MTNTTLRVAALTLAMLTLNGVAHAQRPTDAAPAVRNSQPTTAADRTKGFMLGVHTIGAQGITLTGPDIDGSFGTTFGAGAGATIGFGVTSRFSAFASIDLAKQKTSPNDTPDGSWGLAHFEIGARANLPLGMSSTVPYLTGSWGRRALAARVSNDEGDHADVSFSGTMVAVGGGIEHFITPTMAIDAGVGIGFGKLSDYEEDGEKGQFQLDGSRSMRFRLGLTWRPGAR